VIPLAFLPSRSCVASLSVALVFLYEILSYFLKEQSWTVHENRLARSLLVPLFRGVPHHRLSIAPFGRPQDGCGRHPTVLVTSHSRW